MKVKGALTKEEEKIIREQILKNSKVIDWIIYKIDLLMNKEGHKNDSRIVQAMRKKLDILMAENDTFRRVFWKHIQRTDKSWRDGLGDAVRYLLMKVKMRREASNGNLVARSTSVDYEIGTTSA